MNQLLSTIDHLVWHSHPVIKDSVICVFENAYTNRLYRLRGRPDFSYRVDRVAEGVKVSDIFTTVLTLDITSEDYENYDDLDTALEALTKYTCTP